MKAIMWLGLAGLCATVLSLAGIFLYLDPQVPQAESYRNVQLETPLRILAQDGALLAEFGERRLIPVELKQVPEYFILALLDTEDKRFYEHNGIDFISLTNDLLSLIDTLVTKGELGPGASTITMQLARNVSFSLEKRFLRKFKEMLLALKIEQELSKDEILELYVNLVPFGKRAYGVEAAARTYYGKTLSELTLPQLAMLAGIPQRPSAGNPINGPQWALTRRNVVLSRMRAQESISAQQYETAIATPLTARIHRRELDVASPYAAEWVRQQTITLLPDLYTGGYEIYTTIDSRMQARAKKAIRKGLTAYDRRHGYRGAESQLPDELLEQVIAAAIEVSAAESNLATPAYSASLSQEIALSLASMPVYGGLEPAAVMAVSDSVAWVQRSSSEVVALGIEDSRWARSFIEVDLRGPPPKTMHDILQLGDIIRIDRKDETWILAQLPKIEGALVSIQPNTGRVLSLVGGYDFYRNQYNHALQAARQPGSSFKPFVYSAAIASGVTPADMFMDAPLVFDDANLESQYRPDNDNKRYSGPTRLRKGLYSSINLVSMRVLLKVGAGNVLDHVSKFGFNTRNFPRNTQLAIGGGTMAVTPIAMARGYAVLANGGYLIDPHVVDYIHDSYGEVIFRANHPQICKACEKELQAQALEESTLVLPETEEVSSLETLLAADENPELEIEVEVEVEVETDALDPTAEIIMAPRAIDERNAFIMNSMLQDVINKGTGRRARVLERGDLAGKTGTTNDAADTWFNGYNPNLVTTVWVGFGNHQPLGATAYGSNTPLPIWIDFMQQALADTPEVSPIQPSGVVTMKIDPDTGKPATPGARNAIFEYFLSEFTPRRTKHEESHPPANEHQEVKAIDLF